MRTHALLHYAVQQRCGQGDCGHSYHAPQRRHDCVQSIDQTHSDNVCGAAKVRIKIAYRVGHVVMRKFACDAFCKSEDVVVKPRML